MMKSGLQGMDVDTSLYPCMFNMPHFEVKFNRYKELSFKLMEDFKQNLNADEQIWLLDLLTWVHFKLNHFDESLKFNDQAIKDSQRLVSIANRMFVLKRHGREIETHGYKRELDNLLSNDDNKSEAKAQQAYSCLRLGGNKNLHKAVELFKSAIGHLKGSKLFLSQFYHGLSYRRLVHPFTLSCSKTQDNLQEFVTEAECLFHEVIKKSGDSNLISRSYSELLVLRHDVRSLLSEEEFKKLKNQSVEELCDKALELEPNNPRVLTACGRILCFENESSLRKGVKLLERSVKLKECTTAYHNLGLGYMKLYEMEFNKSGSNGKKEGLKPSYENQRVKEAMEYLQKAIKISKSYNLPAMFDLGKLLKSIGDFQKALIEFNKVIESDTRNDICFFLVIDSLEQSGLCLLELYEIETDMDQKAYYKKQAENKLTQAVGLHAQLVSSVPVLKPLTAKMWNALRTLKSEYECEERSPVMIKKLVNLLNVALEHKEVLRFIKELTNDDIKDPDVAKQALESFLAEGEYTNAFGFLNTLNTLPSPVTIDADLRLKVQLKMAASQLIRWSFNPRSIFKAMFDQHYSHAKDKSVDVLIVYDDSHDTEKHQSQVTDMANQLNDIFCDTFGLEADINVKGSCLYGCKISVQLEQMKSSRLVLVLLGPEQRDIEYDAVLKFVPQLENSSDVHVLTVSCTVKVPKILSTCRHLCIENKLPTFQKRSTGVSNPEDFTRSGQQDVQLELNGLSTNHDTGQMTDFNQDIDAVQMSIYSRDSPASSFKMDEVQVNNVMELFCFLLNTTWN